MKKILIVTPSIEQSVYDDEMGSAFTSLSVNLAKAGFSVDVLYTALNNRDSENKSSDYLRENYEKQNVNLIFLPPLNNLNLNAPYCRVKSYTVYEWLKEHNRYDIVIGCEWQADLYYCLLARGQGLFFTNTRFMINTHGSTLWADEGNYQLPCNQNHLELYFMEQKVVEMADEIISPTHYMINWMRAKKWILPQKKQVIFNCVPFSSENNEAADKEKNEPASSTGIELVFFGAPEAHKGLDLFLRALQNLEKKVMAKISAITFFDNTLSMGKGHSAAQYIIQKTEELHDKINIISHEQIEDYIKREHVLVVISSVIDNSPYSVYECLLNNVNFIASSVGGIKELISPQYHEAVLFEPTVASLCRKIIERLDNLQTDAHLIMSPEDITSRWVSLLNEPVEAIIQPKRNNLAPRVSVCLVHHDRSLLLKQAIASLKAQTYKNFEVILVDDGSTQEASHRYLNLIEEDFLKRGWQIIRSANNYLGAARNLAAKKATGEYLIFMDDDNVAKPHEIETFVRAACYSDCDILTTPSDWIRGNDMPEPSRRMTEAWLPLGSDLNVASFDNCFGDANAIIKKQVFDNLGGFTEDYGVGHEDWEFFCRAALAGYKIQLIPESLFWYRLSESGMLLSGSKDRNNYRSYRPFMSADNRIQYTMAIIPSFYKRIKQLEQELDVYRNKNAAVNNITLIQERLDYLISQQEKGWAHDRFNVAHEAQIEINNKIDYLISQQKEGWANDRFNITRLAQRDINNKIEHLISQQRDGWASERFNVIADKLDYVISQQKKDRASNRLNIINNKLDRVISRQKDVWVHKRINEIDNKINVILSQPKNMLQRLSRKMKTCLKIKNKK